MAREHAWRAAGATLLAEERKVGDDCAAEREKNSELDCQGSMKSDAGAPFAPDSLSAGRGLRLTCRSQEAGTVGAVKGKPIAALAAVALVAAASGTGAAPSSCVPSGINTLRASAAARTYSRAGGLGACPRGVAHGCNRVVIARPLPD